MERSSFDRLRMSGVGDRAQGKRAQSIVLRGYQQEVAKAVMRSVRQKLGLTFTVMIARQGGKNELSAHLEAMLLMIYGEAGGEGVKAAPTFKPQVINSIHWLKDRLNDMGVPAAGEYGYQVRLGRARWLFFSASTESNVVGATALILLEGDEAQDIGKEKWDRDFRPMGRSRTRRRCCTGRPGRGTTCCKRRSS